MFALSLTCVETGLIILWVMDRTPSSGSSRACKNPWETSYQNQVSKQPTHNQFLKREWAKMEIGWDEGVNGKAAWANWA